MVDKGEFLFCLIMTLAVIALMGCLVRIFDSPQWVLHLVLAAACVIVFIVNFNDKQMESGGADE